MGLMNGAGPVSAATEIEAREFVSFGKSDGSKPTPNQTQALRAELTGSDTCAAAGITAKGSTPVLALCRELLAAGVNPDQALEVYRGAMLALRIRSIRETAGLEINGEGNGFRAWRTPAPAPPMRQNGRGVP